MSVNHIQAKTFYLREPLSTTATTMRVRNFKDIYGTALTMADFGTLGALTVNPGKDNEEIVYFTGITVNGTDDYTLTGVVRGVAAVSPYDTSGTAQEHVANSVVIVSNNSYWLLQMLNKNNDHTITGTYTFSTLPQGTSDPVGANELARRSWVLSVIAGGTVSFDQMTIPATAGQTISDLQVVYQKESDQEWYKTDADDSATFDGVLVGIARGAGTNGLSISGGVTTQGYVTTTGLTAGSKYYLANSAGNISTTPGTTEFYIGRALSTTVLYVNPQYIQIPTAKEKDALVGSQGIPSTDNKFLTEDNSFSAEIDQSQETVDATVEFGEADSSGRKNTIVQSFVPTKTKIRGFRLYKETDTGTFTGSVTVALQADSSGEPAGSDLASVTITNTNWALIAADTLFDAIFDTEYASIVPGDTYWIVISASTADNTNHPNLGTNSAGGYGSGSTLYQNTTDGYVAIATIDLVFYTLLGNANQVTVTDEYGRLHPKILVSKLVFDTTQYALPSTNSVDQNLATATVPGGALNGAVIEAKIWISGFVDDGNTHTIKLKYGSTTVASLDLTNPGINAAVDNGYIEAVLVGIDNERQKGAIMIDVRDEGQSVSGTELPRYFNQAFGTATEDSTGDLDFSVAVFSPVASGNTITTEIAVVKITR